MRVEFLILNRLEIESKLTRKLHLGIRGAYFVNQKRRSAAKNMKKRHHCLELMLAAVFQAERVVI